MKFQNLLNKKSIERLILIAVVVGMAFFRVRAYQDSLSIGTSDTGVFVESSQIPFPSLDFFSSNRPASISLLYKIIEPDTGYQLNLVSLAWVGTEADRVYQPGFDRLATAQSILSILGWSLLALVLAYRLKTFPAKILAVVVVLVFAYSPQLADWDGVLMSESLAFSLFAFVLALTIEIVSRIATEGKNISKASYGIASLWLFFITLWVFARDSNAYFLVITICLIGGLLLFKKIRNLLPARLLIVFCFFLVGIFIFHNTTLRQSNRWVNPLFNNILKNVLPFPERLEYFKELGLPVNDEMMALINSHGNERGFFEIEELVEWVNQDGFSAYTRFLIQHPLWAFAELEKSKNVVFNANRQPYFRGSPESTPLWLLPIGDLLHIRSSLIVLIDLLLSLLIVGVTLKQCNRWQFAWSWIVIWLFLGEAAMLFVSFHGDALGKERHTLGAVMPFRLSVWLLIFVIFDFVFQYFQNRKKVNIDAEKSLVA